MKGKRRKRPARHAARIDPGNWQERAEQLPLLRTTGRKHQPGKRRAPDAEPSAPEGEAEAALVIAVGSRRCQVVHGGEMVECRLRADLAARQRADLAVGDQVTVIEQAGARWVSGVLPRRTALYRPDPRDPRLRRVVVANVDLVVIVAAVREPELRPGLIDRYLIAIEQGGAEAALCVNKTDLASGPDDAALAEALAPYRELGLPVLTCSAREGQGLAPLRQLLAGKLAALVGHSGVGKSSLLNALQPELDLVTGTVGGAGSGRHTTTRATLHQLPGDVRIIDTPGIRELGLWQPTRNDLHEGFPDFAAAASRCRFANCSHSHEPDCGVQRAVAEGTVSPARYATWRRILDSLGDG